MNTTSTLEAERASAELMLGDEAVALGALHAGISNAYAYPGTPSTEIFERLVHEAARTEGVTAHWSANEKAAMEEALGATLAGRRALVTMKHVGLNVAADPFVNSALVALGGGLVVAVADDPGMHSSQNEQDSRFYADFARVPCLEPATAQEAYDMTREAFDLSETFQVPVVVRLVTRLCHERGAVTTAPPRAPNPLAKAGPRQDWVLLPGNSRRLWARLLESQPAMRAWSEGSTHNVAHPGRPAASARTRLGVITTGVARRYYREVLPELGEPPPHLHLGAYPLPVDLVRSFASGLERVLVIEEGYPFVERMLRGTLPGPVEVLGRDSGAVPASGELSPGVVRAALGLPPLPHQETPEGVHLPGRPPQLCEGCAHRDAFSALQLALAEVGPHVVTGDIGCYTLGALPPYGGIDTCVCMGASVGLAKGASDAGLRPALAVIGDSTFLHSGVTPLMDAAAHDTDMTLLILDNRTVAMTGGQPTALASSRIAPLVQGLGVDPEHVHEVHAHPREVPRIAEHIRREMAHRGLSVIVLQRECIVTARSKKKKS